MGGYMQLAVSFPLTDLLSWNALFWGITCSAAMSGAGITSREPPHITWHCQASALTVTDSQPSTSAGGLTDWHTA